MPKRFSPAILALLAAAALLYLIGTRAVAPTPVEASLLGRIEALRASGESFPGVARALKEVSQAVDAELEEQARAQADPVAAGRWLADAREDLERVMRGVRQYRDAVTAAPPAGKTALDVAESLIRRHMSVRDNGYDISAGFLVFLAALVTAFKIIRPRRRTRERLIRRAFLATATVCILILLLILAFLFAEGLPVLQATSLSDFLLGRLWYPTEEPPVLGILPLMAGSLAVTLVSSLMAIPLGVMTAVYLAEIARPRVREVFKPVIELLASLPSVVIGFFGMVVVAPFLQETFNLATGLNLFNASVMLAFMSVPTITSVSEDAISAVPKELKEASLALGGTHLQSILRVVLPASLSGISTAVILGMSRSIGETMVVLMVAGGAGLIPGSLFDPVRPMPASIAAEMGEAPFQSPHYHALFAIGMVLFAFTLIFNFVADHVSHKYKQVGAATL